MVSDPVGMYYDAGQASLLEKLIFGVLDDQAREHAHRLIRQWRELRLSKYNAKPEYSRELPERYVLLVDQVAGDLSIEYGLADGASFTRMLDAALGENSDATVVVKVHPDVYTRAKAGHFDVEELGVNPRIQVVAENCHPVRLIEHAEAVYTVTSQVGFEALIWGKRVRCFGMPFYAGWGLTEDELPAPDRRGKASLEQLVHAALVDYPRYLDPERKERCEVETVMEHIGLQRRMRFRFPETVYALGFTPWKRPLLELFLSGSKVVFVRQVSEIPENATVALWGNGMPSGLSSGINVLRVEDGFLRSSGLGGDLIRPLSWVIDDQGLYYDASRPSRLESLLQAGEFDEELLARAKALRENIVVQGISKYNLKGTAWKRPSDNRRVVLVVGQVENDASIRFGAGAVNTNLGLLQAVREGRPDACVVYKPHPEVVAGLRRPGAGEDQARAWCDEIIEAGDTAPLFDRVDEVHVMTSLAGFEALLRGVPVTCHGRPFYAGWGLTTDLVPVERRTRTLSLDELVAGTLILYPTYVSRISNAFATPERAVAELMEWSRSGVARMPLHRRALRQVFRWWAASGLRRNA